MKNGSSTAYTDICFIPVSKNITTADMKYTTSEELAEYNKMLVCLIIVMLFIIFMAHFWPVIEQAAIDRIILVCSEGIIATLFCTVFSIVAILIYTFQV